LNLLHQTVKECIKDCYPVRNGVSEMPTDIHAAKIDAEKFISWATTAGRMLRDQTRQKEYAMMQRLQVGGVNGLGLRVLDQYAMMQRLQVGGVNGLGLRVLDQYAMMQRLQVGGVNGLGLRVLDQVLGLELQRLQAGGMIV
jgi:hypothetical protein